MGHANFAPVSPIIWIGSKEDLLKNYICWGLQISKQMFLHETFNQHLSESDNHQVSRPKSHNGHIYEKYQQVFDGTQWALGKSKEVA